MTDEQVIKALEQCGNIIVSSCKDCPLHEKYNANCVRELTKESLDLIKRQQAEIEELKNDTIPKLQESLKRANKYGLESDKENERLKQILNSYALQYGTVTDQSKKIKEIKDEAYKEFAERLEYEVLHEDIEVNALKCRDYESFYNGANQFRYQAKECVSRILKELTEGSNDKV